MAGSAFVARYRGDCALKPAMQILNRWDAGQEMEISFDLWDPRLVLDPGAPQP